MADAWPITCDASAPFGERAAQVAISAFADGILRDDKRIAFYVAMMACGGKEKLIPINGTTCAMFAGAVWYWAGRRVALPRFVAVTSITSWLDTRFTAGAGWRAFGHAECIPEVGAIFYVESDANAYNNHVGVLVRELAPGVWLCAEGGQDAGSTCRMTVRRWGPKWDSRRIRGLWIPSRFSDAELARIGPPPPAPGLAPPTFPIKPGGPADDVRRWQQRLLDAGYSLPRWGVDGAWGTKPDSETTLATNAAQLFHGMPSEASCSKALWDAVSP